MMVSVQAVIAAAILSLLVSLSNGAAREVEKTVTYDGRSLIINGRRELFFSGSIHYPRSTPDMWPELLRKAKQGGLNVIQTYVFWNLHEPIEGQFNFEGNYDVVKFIKMIADYGMYVTLRIGPFIEAEWNFGGFPYWLKEKPNVEFRSYNQTFMNYMEKYSRMIIDMMKKEKLFAPQGGPIILAQIENEYNSIQDSYKKDNRGAKYVQWAGKMALGLGAGVPWVMCKQKDAPDPVIPVCNGRHCADTFTFPNRPNKPFLWTENWTAQYRVFGDPPSQRSAEDLAYSVARFVSMDGTLSNYYMYHGGTNFGRTTSTFVTTRYYDEAPLDEYGLQREPKWGHLKDLHSALKLCKKALFRGRAGFEQLGREQEARLYEAPGTKVCAAFLTNNHTKESATVTFRGQEYFLPPHSVSILPDCKTVVFNTQTVVSQHNSRNFVKSNVANKNLNWEMSNEKIPVKTDLKGLAKAPRELYSFLKDVSDYAWFVTSIELNKNDLPFKKGITPVLQVSSLGHAMVAFVNGNYTGTAHGSNLAKGFVYREPVMLKPGNNSIALLCMTLGLPDAGAYMDRKYAGVDSVAILGLNTGTLDLTKNGWSNQVSVNGELAKVFTQEGSQKVQWTKAEKDKPVTWYKAYFDKPERNDPVILRMASMAKGMMWVNGNCLGRYWVSYLSALGQPTQSDYHIPRAWIKPKDNLLVIFEETGGNHEEIEIQVVNRDTICSLISALHPAHVKSWQRHDAKIRAVADDLNPSAQLTCPDNKVVTKVEFAAFGNPFGACGDFEYGNCTAPDSVHIVEQYCLGKSSCRIPLSASNIESWGGLCAGIIKTMAVQLNCGHKV